MNTPPGLLAAACALWGAQTGYWLVAAAAAIALEAPRLVALRWNVAQAHFNRLSDFCSVLVIATGGYLYVTFGNPRALMLLFQWFPVLMLPLGLAQAWGNVREVGIAAFVWTLRKGDTGRQPALNLAYPYVAVWIIAAAASNARTPVFFIGLAGVVAWGLWTARPRKSSIVIWAMLVAIAAAGGYGLQHGLFRMQGWIEELVPEWLSASGSRTDPYRSRTDLGHIGEIKQDDAIVLRVRAEQKAGGPLLLHRASYNSYFGRTWTARNDPFVAQFADGSTHWALAPARAGGQVTVYDYSPRGNPVLSLPPGTVEVRNLEALSIRVNGLGTVQADTPPGYFSYVAATGTNSIVAAPPGEEDLKIPRSEEPLFKEIAASLGIAGGAAEAAAAAVKVHFSRDFGYSTYQPAVATGASVLADFMLKTRSGHCEYFATATVLLLRAAGVPARYATGFSAQEYSRLEEAYIVRVRHAHAWARAYVDGRWVDIDTTPPTWLVIEDGAASWWAPVSDFWAWTRFRLSQLGGARSEDKTTLTVAVAAALIALWFGWRLYRQRRLMVFGRQSAQGISGASTPGADSELFLVERALAEAGLGRLPSETVMAWVGRVTDRLPSQLQAAVLGELAALHYRYRFDPAGLGGAERERLRVETEAWLAAHAAAPASPPATTA